jgi:phage-related protein
MAFDAGSIEATLTLNRNPFTEGLKLARRQANDFERNDIEVPVKPTLDQSALQRIRAQLDRLRGTATVRARLDQTSLTSIRNQINRAVGRIQVRAQFDNSTLVAIRERINRAVGTIKVRAEFDNASLAELRAKLAALRDVKIRVKIDIDDSDLVRLEALLQRIRNGLRGATGDSDRFGGSLGRAGMAGGGLMQALIVGLPVILPLLGSAITATVGLAGALLSAGTIAATGLGSIALVAKPVFTAIQEGSKKSAAEIAKLPPGIREGATAFKAMEDAYNKLVAATRTSVGNMMAQGFNAATTALKTLNPIIDATAKVLGQIGIQINNYFKSEHWTSFVQFVSKSIGPVLQKLFDIVAYGTRAVMNLTKAFEPLAQWILQGIVDGMKDFATWTEKLATNPAFQKFVDVVKDSLPKVWEFIKTTIEFLMKLSIALAPIGDAILTLFTKVLDALNKVPPELLGPIAVGIAGIFAALALGATGPVGIAVGVILAIAAGMKYLYDNSQPVRDLFDKIGTELKNWFIPLWKELVDLFDKKVKPAWERLTDQLKKDFLPVAEKMWTTFKDEVLPVIGEVAKIVVGKLIPAFLDFYTAVSPIIAWIYEKIGPIILEVFERVVRVIGNAFEIIGGLLQAFAGLFSGDWEKLWEGVKTVCENIMGIIGSLFGFNLNEWKMKIYMFGQDVSAKWTEFTDWIKNTTQKFTEWVSGTWNGFWDALRDWFTKTKDSIVQGWNDFWNNVTTKLSEMVTNITNAWNNFWQGIHDWVMQKWEAIKQGWNNFWTNVSTTLSNFISSVTTAWNNFWQNVSDIAVRIWEAIKQTVGNALEWVRSTVSTVGDAIGAAWRKVANFFRDPINWVINVVLNDGIMNAWNTVMGWIGAESLKAGRIPDIPAFATGGPVPMTPGAQQGKDSVLLRAMPGEFILSTKDVAAMGGIAGVEGLRRRARYDKNGRTYHDTFNGDPKQRIPGFADGGAVQRAQAFANAQVGKPYIWGGVGPGGYDCSGFMSAITNVLRGAANPYTRRFTTASFANGPVDGFVNGLSSAFSIGVKQGNPGHMAGTLGGLNVESTGDHVRTGGAAAGADHPQFTAQFSLPEVGGVFAPGGGGTLASWWEILGSKVTALFDGLRNLVPQLPMGGPFGEGLKAMPLNLINKAFDAIKTKLLNSFNIINAVNDAVAGAIKDQVRAVAARYGWGDGVQWDAINAIISRESGWDPMAANPNSSARGLFQKMTSLHGPVEPTVTGQAEWGLNYIKTKYGDPVNALAYWNAHGNYHNGGWLMPGAYSHNETYEPEAIFNRPQITAMHEAIKNAGRRGALDDEFVEKLIQALASAKDGMGDGVSIGSVTLPYGASVRELADECNFRVKHANKGRYGGKRW